jgi:hypothetical protein
MYQLNNMIIFDGLQKEEVASLVNGDEDVWVEIVDTYEFAGGNDLLGGDAIMDDFFNSEKNIRPGVSSSTKSKKSQPSLTESAQKKAKAIALPKPREPMARPNTRISTGAPEPPLALNEDDPFFSEPTTDMNTDMNTADQSAITYENLPTEQPPKKSIDIFAQETEPLPSPPAQETQKPLLAGVDLTETDFFSKKGISSPQIKTHRPRGRDSLTCPHPSLPKKRFLRHPRPPIQARPQIPPQKKSNPDPSPHLKPPRRPPTRILGR